MGLMSDDERNEFRISISSQPLKKLRELFNQLSKDRDNDHFSDYKRGIAGEKAKMVNSQIKIREGGGSSG